MDLEGFESAGEVLSTASSAADVKCLQDREILSHLKVSKGD